MSSVVWVGGCTGSVLGKLNKCEHLQSIQLWYFLSIKQLNRVLQCSLRVLMGDCWTSLNRIVKKMSRPVSLSLKINWNRYNSQTCLFYYFILNLPEQLECLAPDTHGRVWVSVHVSYYKHGILLRCKSANLPGETGLRAQRSHFRLNR